MTKEIKTVLIFGLIFSRMGQAINSHKPDMLSRAGVQLTEAFQSVFFGYSARTVFFCITGESIVVVFVLHRIYDWYGFPASNSLEETQSQYDPLLRNATALSDTVRSDLCKIF